MSASNGKFIQIATILFNRFGQNGATTNDRIFWNGTAWVAGKVPLVIETYSVNSTLVNNEQDVVLVNASSPVTITLFSVAGRKKTLKIKNIGTANVTISTSNLIDGNATTLMRSGNAFELIPTGATWYIF